MNSPVISKDKVQIDIACEIMKLIMKIGIVLCTLIGTLAVTCLVSTLISTGPLQMARGYITAITGY